ncbi:unnamed protein product, partial [Mesorhabditis belari]|uniref:Uncharacterized protein n=1 Tax=Mesorhabditis belari TaxID=2138241 RepID=A0AAF3FFJ6_9BILA
MENQTSPTSATHSSNEVPKTPNEKIGDSWINSDMQMAVTPNDKVEEDFEEKKENLMISAEKMPSVKVETPEAVRMRREQQAELQKKHVSSPSDSMLSPCTSKLFGKDPRRKAQSGPAALLRKKQQGAIPCNFSAEDEE